MIIPVCVDDDTVLNIKDEKKLVNIEKEENVVFKVKSNYSDIKVSDTYIGRMLMFDLSYQGGMINYNNYIGGMPYTRYLNLAKVLNEDIKSILILGLGVGTNIKDSLQIYKPERIDVIEIDSEVINLAEQYFDISSSGPVNIYNDDARNFVFNTKNKYDLILVDVFFEKGMPLNFMKIDFIEKLHEITTNEGIIAVNLFGKEKLSGDCSCIFNSQYKSYASCFKNLYVFPVLYGAYEFYRCACNLRYRISEFTNVVLIAQKNGCFIDKKAFIQRAKRIQNDLCLPFMKNYSLYARDYYQGEVNTANLKIIDDSFPENIKNTQQAIVEYIKY